MATATAATATTRWPCRCSRRAARTRGWFRQRRPWRPPPARGGYGAPGAVPQARAELSPEAINLDDFYSSVETVPPAALGATPASLAQQPGAEWIPAERPIIRAQSGGGSAPLVRRAPSQMSPRPPADELGVEESEFDKPTYLRRGLFAPE